MYNVCMHYSAFEEKMCLIDIKNNATMEKNKLK